MRMPGSLAFSLVAPRLRPPFRTSPLCPSASSPCPLRVSCCSLILLLCACATAAPEQPQPQTQLHREARFASIGLAKRRSPTCRRLGRSVLRPLAEPSRPAAFGWQILASVRASRRPWRLFASLPPPPPFARSLRPSRASLPQPPQKAPDFFFAPCRYDSPVAFRRSGEPRLVLSPMFSTFYAELR